MATKQELNPSAVELRGKVLKYTERPYKRQNGSDATYKDALVLLGNTVVRFRVGDTSLANFEGSEATLTIEFYSFGDDISAQVRIVSAVE